MNQIEKEYAIEKASLEDLDQIVQVEACCFPPAEAADRESLGARLQVFPDSFLVARRKEDGRIIGFINGAVTNQTTISDDMFEDAGLHDPHGRYQSIFGLDVIPEYRRQGIGADLMNHMIETAAAQGRKGLILTCKDHKIAYYQRFGYVNLGVSQSVHGGAVWYDMILELPA